MDVVDSSYSSTSSWNPDLFSIKADDLEIIDTVGEGGFGVVHRARHLRWGIVAFKKLNSEFIKRSEGNKWKKEAVIQSRLDHPNIIKFLALVFEPKNYGMVLEFAKHGDLSDYIAEHEPAWNQKLSLIHDTVSGMCYLHSLSPPIIHGDLKLQNILVSANLTAKICDFGFAQKMKEYSRSLSCSDLKAGTVTHVPPEAWTHPNRPRSEKFDVYSFGICVWEIITGLKPFEGTQLCVIPTIVREVGFQPDLGLIPVEISKNMTEMIKSCWSQVADRRPTTIQIKESVEKEMNILPGTEETNETKTKNVSSNELLLVPRSSVEPSVITKVNDNGSVMAAANEIPMKNSTSGSMTNSKSISTKRLPKKELLYSKESKVEADVSRLLINLPYIIAKTAGVTNKLVVCMQEAELISTDDSNAICRYLYEKDKWNKLATILPVKHLEDVRTLANCFRDLKLNDLADLFESGGVILKVMVCLGETPNSILTEMRLAKIVNFVVNYKGQRKREIDKDLDSLRDADTRILEVMNHVSPGIVIWMWCQSLSGYQKLKKHGFLMKTVSKLFKDMHFTTLELERLRIDEEKRTEGYFLKYNTG